MLPPLRPYQATAVAAVRAHWQAGRRAVCLVAPCGAGKSRMATELVLGAQRTLWLVHRTDLERQARSVLWAAGLGNDRVHVSTIQRVLARDHRPRADLVVCDEFHHFVQSNSWGEFLSAYPQARIVGPTATPERQDGSPLGDIATALVVAARYSELLALAHLVPARVLRPAEPLRRGLAMDPVAAYRNHAENGTGFCFVPRVEEAERVAAEFCANGIAAAVVHATTPGRERSGALKRLASGALRLIVNCGTMTEGVDVPSASVCILATMLGHVGGYLQRAGRILRPAPGKTEALLLDLPGLSHSYGLPTDDREYSLSGQAISSAAPSLTTCLMCGHVYPSGPERCPACGFEKPSEDWKPLRIYNVALQAVYKGAATDDDAKRAEYRRLREVAARKGWSLSWVQVMYRKLFGTSPAFDDVTPAEWRAEYGRLAALAAERGYKPGFAAARFKALAGWWPERSMRA